MSESRAADRRADALQLIERSGSPGDVRPRSRDVGSGSPPRASHRAEGEPDDPAARNEGKRRVGQGDALRGLAVSQLGRRDEPETGVAELIERLLPARPSRLRPERGSEDDPVRDDREEQLLHVVGRDVLAAVQERPRTCRALER